VKALDSEQMEAAKSLAVCYEAYIERRGWYWAKELLAAQIKTGVEIIPSDLLVATAKDREDYA